MRFEAERNQSNFKLGNRGFQGVDFAMTQRKGKSRPKGKVSRSIGVMVPVPRKIGGFKLQWRRHKKKR